MKNKVCSAILFCFVSTAAAADPTADPASNTLCRGYDETIEGHWMNNGEPALLWRLGSDRDGSGCYTVLHSYPQWGIREFGEIQLPKVTWNGELRDAGCVTVNLETGTSTFTCQGASATGEVVKVE
ncbi:MAG: hypothetical protein AAGA12_03180 [Pseudomonadota bacterium]